MGADLSKLILNLDPYQDYSSSCKTGIRTNLRCGLRQQFHGEFLALAWYSAGILRSGSRREGCGRARRDIGLLMGASRNQASGPVSAVGRWVGLGGALCAAPSEECLESN